MKLFQPVIVKKEVNDEHYYFITVDEKSEPVFYPSVTKLLGETLPTPYALRQWIGDVGNEKAEIKLNKAADRGTRIHDACEAYLRGEEINLEQNFPNEKDKKLIVAFANWCAEYQPRIPQVNEVFNSKSEDPTIEFTVASTWQYAGTLDIFCYIKDEPYIIDIKTSRNVYDSHMLQITAYQEAFREMTGIKAKRAILHLKDTTQKGWQFVEKIEIKKKDVTIDDFMNVYSVYKMLNGGEVPQPPLTESYPEVIKRN